VETNTLVESTVQTRLSCLDFDEPALDQLLTARQPGRGGAAAAPPSVVAPSRPPAKAPPAEGDQLFAIFTRFDTDGSGTIDARELQGALAEAAKVLLTTEQAAALLDKVEDDEQRDGVLSWEEFRAAFASMQLRSPSPSPPSPVPLQDLDRGAERRDKRMMNSGTWSPVDQEVVADWQRAPPSPGLRGVPVTSRDFPPAPAGSSAGSSRSARSSKASSKASKASVHEQMLADAALGEAILAAEKQEVRRKERTPPTQLSESASTAYARAVGDSAALEPLAPVPPPAATVPPHLSQLEYALDAA
jgi:hypothetical protein